MASYSHQIEVVKNTGIAATVASGFLFFLVVLLFGFSAYITRTTADSQTEDGPNLDRLIHSIEELNRLERAIAASQEDLALMIQSRTLVESEIETAKRGISILNASSSGAIGSHLADLLLLVTPDSDSALKRTMLDALSKDQDAAADDSPMPFLQSRRFVTNIQTYPFQNADSKAKADTIVAQISQTLKDYTTDHGTLRHDISQKTVERDRYSLQIELETGALTNLKEQWVNTRAGIPDGGEALFASLDLLGGVLLIFIKMPTIILTLIVTIAAGGLASLVSFARKFLHNGNNVGVSRLLSNVAEGIAASIGIFLFAGTGMLMLTQGSGDAATRVELSPYMVAFMAFLSGFMAESAFKKIEDTGKRLFNSDEPKKDKEDTASPPEDAPHIPLQNPSPSPEREAAA